MRAILIAVTLLTLAACGVEQNATHDQLAQARRYMAADNSAAAIAELQRVLERYSNAAQAHWLLGTLYLQIDDMPGAEYQFLRAQELGWDADDTRAGLSAARFAQGKFAQLLQMGFEDLDPHAASLVLANQALAALAQGATDAPLQLVALAREQDPQSLDARIVEATVTLHLREPRHALVLAGGILASDPENSEALWIKGQALTRLGRAEDARAAFDKSVTLRGTNLSHRLAHVLRELHQQEFSAAQTDVTELLKLLPHNPLANYVQGTLAVRASDYRNAIAPLRLAEPVAERFPMTLYRLGTAYLMGANLFAAQQSAQRFVELQPDDPDGRKLLAVIQLEAGEYAQAIATLQPVLDNNPNDVAAMNIIANCLLLDDQAGPGMALYARIRQQQRDWPVVALHKEAALVLDDAAATDVELASADPDANFPQDDVLRILGLLQDGNFAAAIIVGKTYQLRAPNRLSPYHVLATVYLAAGQQDHAAEALQQALQLSPTDPVATRGLAALGMAPAESADAHYQAALAANSAGDLELSRQHLQKAIALDPDHVASLVGLAKIARLDGKQEAFDEKLATLQEIAPQAPEVLRLGALSAQLRGNSATALSLAEHAFAQAPSNEALLELTALRKAAGKIADAKAGLRQWLETHPDDTAVRFSLADTLEQMNDVPAAQMQYMAVLQQDPGNIRALNNLAWSQRLDDPQQALANIRKAVRLSPDLPILLDTLAVIESLNGDHAAAQKTMHHALTIAPEDPTLRMHDAMITAARGEKAEAIAALIELLSQYPDGFPERAEAEALLKSLRG